MRDEVKTLRQTVLKSLVGMEGESGVQYRAFKM
jgi:hypothetical protein